MDLLLHREAILPLRIACVAGLHPSGIEPGTIPYPCLQKASEIVKIFKTFQSFQTTFHYLLINKLCYIEKLLEKATPEHSG